MPAITKTTITAGANTLTETTLDGSDSFEYDSSGREILTLHNDTGGALTPTIDGDGATTVKVGGVGDVDISSGFSVGSIADGAAVAIPLDSIKEYLAGTIAITGGTGLVATLMTH